MQEHNWVSTNSNYFFIPWYLPIYICTVSLSGKELIEEVRLIITAVGLFGRFFVVINSSTQEPIHMNEELTVLIRTY